MLSNKQFYTQKQNKTKANQKQKKSESPQKSTVHYYFSKWEKKATIKTENRQNIQKKTLSHN